MSTPEASASETNPPQIRPKCGLVMPISACDGCTAEHWLDVHTILSDAIAEAGFDARLVSKDDSAGIIHKWIVQNLYEDPVIVCDVSGLNPNVMLELGMRLAFDKPLVIVKDDKTRYTFDASPIEHLQYPRDLRFNAIVDFKRNLAAKVQATANAAKSDPNHSSFLRHFGPFKAVTIPTESVTENQLVLEAIQEVRDQVHRLSTAQLRDMNAGTLSLLNDQEFLLDYARSIILDQANTLAQKKTFDSLKELRNELFSSVLSHAEIRAEYKRSPEFKKKIAQLIHTVDPM